MWTLLADLRATDPDLARVKVDGLVEEWNPVDKVESTVAPEGGKNIECVETPASTAEAGPQSKTPLSASTPLAPVTVGWDKRGSPLAVSNGVKCAYAVLELPHVARWFVSYDGEDDLGPKV